MADEIKLNNFGNIKAYGQDGKISQEELETLKKQGVNQEILDALSGAESQEEINDIANKYFNGEQIPEEKSKFKAWLEKSPHNVLITVLGGGALALLGGVKGLLVGGLLSSASCTTEMNQQMNITISPESSDQEIIQHLKDIHGELIAIKGNQEQLEKIVTEMVSTLLQIGIDTDRMVNILELIGADISTITTTLAANGVKADEIINLIQQNNDKQDVIIDKLSNGNKETAELLKQILVAVNNGNTLTTTNNNLLTQILTKISTIEANDKEGNDLLNQILAKLTESIETQKEMNSLTTQFYTDVLAKIDLMKNDMKSGFNKVLEKLDTLDANQRGIANTILANIEKMNASQQDFFGSVLENLDSMDANITAGIKNILEQMDKMDKNALDAVDQILERMDDMSAEQKTFFSNIIAKLGELSQNQIDVATKILNKLDDMNNDQKAFFEAVLEKLDTLPEGIQEGIDKILNAINDNTAVDKEILATLGDLISKFENLSPGQATDLTVVVNALEALGVDTKAILAEIQKGNSQLENIRESIEKNNQIAAKTMDAVENLKNQNNKDHETIIALMTKLLENDANNAATMDDIKAILNEIKTNTKGNWDTSLRIEDKLNLVAQTINVILETQKELSDDTKAVLLQILAKIPDGCNCETVDLTVIVEKLDALIKATEEGRNDPKHEGILDDLDDLLG